MTRRGVKSFVPQWISLAIRTRHLRSLCTLHPLLSAIYNSFCRETERLYPSGTDRPFLYCFTGYRTRADQQEAVRSGSSQVSYPNSYHNTMPAMAMDIVPIWPEKPGEIEWSSKRTIALLTTLAKSHSQLCTWGGSWSLHDIYHFQLPHGGSMGNAVRYCLQHEGFLSPDEVDRD